MDQPQCVTDNLASNIKYARAATGLSQRHLLALVNGHLTNDKTSAAAIARIELGKREPRLNEMLALSDALCVKPEALTLSPDEFVQMYEVPAAIVRFRRAHERLECAFQDYLEAEKVMHSMSSTHTAEALYKTLRIKKPPLEQKRLPQASAETPGSIPDRVQNGPALR